jgi:accessory gene regulator protein AgrB
MAYLSKIITIPQKIYNAVFAYCFFVYLKYAPSGTEVNPVYKDQIKPLKIKSMLIVVFYYFIGLKNGLLRNIIALSLLSQSIFIIPLTYKLAGQKGGVVHEDE